MQAAVVNDWRLVETRRPAMSLSDIWRGDTDERTIVYMRHWRSLLGLVAALGGGALVSVMAFKITVGGPLNGEVSPWNAIFASRLMLLAARLAVLAFIAYAIASMLASVRRGQWLTRVGPVEVAESTQRLAASRGEASESASWLAEENRRLEREVDQLRAVLDAADLEIP